MRTTTAILFASFLGLSSGAFAATPTDSVAREARMSEALKNHRAATAGAPVQVKATKAPVTKKHKAAKKRSARKQHARAAQSRAVAVKATPANAK